MARTIDEIKTSILAAKAADSNLSGLTSTSKTAIWLLWVNIVAYAHLFIEQLWDQKKLELEEAAEKAVAGTDKWYADRVLEWQYGYSLTESNGKLIYLIDDPDARLVTKVASFTAGRILRIKVAKDSSGDLVALSAAEKASLDTYLRDIKFAGTEHILTSIDADLVKVTAEVFYDGKLDLAAFKTEFELALNSYLKNIYYNGFFNINDFRDSGESLIGTRDFQISSVEIKASGGVYAAVTREYNPASGYFKIDPAFPLSTQITYTAV